MREIKNLRDPLSHPADIDFTYEDAHRLLDCARRVLTRLDLVSDAQRLHQLQRDLQGDPLSRSLPLDDDLPPRDEIVIDFVARGAELDELRRWFADPLSKRWALMGEGGKGKSAIAYRFADEIKQAAPPPFQIVIWLSAKVRRFLERTGVAVGEADVSDLSTALAALLRAYGWDDELSAPLESRRQRCLEGAAGKIGNRSVRRHG